MANGAAAIFATIIVILAVTNVIVIAADPSTDPLHLLTAPNLIANAALIIGGVLLLSLQTPLGGFSDSGIWSLIAGLFMMGLLYAVTIGPLTFGVGLVSRLALLTGDPWGVYALLINLVGVVAIVAGLITISGGGN